MNKRKETDNLQTERQKQKKIARTQQSTEQTKVCKKRNANRQRISRAQESPKQKLNRRQEDATRHKINRTQQSAEQKIKHANHQKINRAQESPEEKMKHANRQKMNRAQESPQQKMNRQQENATRQKIRRTIPHMKMRESTERRTIYSKLQAQQQSCQNEQNEGPPTLDFSLPKHIIVNKDSVNAIAVESNVEVAVMLNYMNAGYELFYDGEVKNDGLNVGQRHQAMISALKKECITNEDRLRIMNNFRETLGLQYNVKENVKGKRRKVSSTTKDKVVNDEPSALLSCAPCGLREYERDKTIYHREALDKFPQLKCSQEQTFWFLNKKKTLRIPLPVNEKGDEKIFDLWKIYNRYEMIFEEEYALYYVLPEFVETETIPWIKPKYFIQICDDCHKVLRNEQVPRMSIANGVDFGNYKRAGIAPVKFMESMILAYVRIYVQLLTMKRRRSTNANAQSSQLMAHCIAFEQDTPIVAAKLFCLQDLVNDIIQFHFLDAEGEIDEMMFRTYKSNLVQIRAHVLYQHLMIQQEMNESFGNFREKIPTLQELREQIETLHFKECTIQSTERDIHNLDDQCETKHISRVIDDRRNTSELKEHTDENIPMDSSVVMRDNPLAIDDDSSNTVVKTFLQQFQQALKINVETPASQRSSTPLNEFTENDKILTGAFPHIFLLGKGYNRSKGALSLKERRHLFLQYDGVAASCKELIFFTVNQMLRHENIRAVHLMIKNNDEGMMSNFFEFVKSATFKSDLQDAIDCPKSTSAKEIIKMLSQIIKMPDRGATCGVLMKNRCKNDLFSMMRKFGACSSFDTIGLDTTNDLNCFRLSVPSDDNTSFPAHSNSKFLRAVEKNALFEDKEGHFLDCSFSGRAVKLISNPIAPAYEYNAFIDCFVEKMQGLSLSYSQSTGQQKRTSQSILQREKGIEGTALATAGANDVSKSGRMHAHLLCYSCPQPQTLERVVDDEILRNLMTKILESRYTAEFTQSTHIFQLMHQWIRQEDSNFSTYSNARANIVPALMQTPPDPVADPETFNGKEEMYSSRTQTHYTHCSRCHARAHGKLGCCSNIPHPLKEESGPIILVPTYNDKNELINLHVTSDIPTLPIRMCAPNTMMNNFQIMVQHNESDNRMILWNGRRQFLSPLKDCGENATEMRNTLREAMKGHRCYEAINRILLQVKDNNMPSLYKFINDALPTANGSVVEHNKVFSSVLGSNHAMFSMGNMTESMNSAMYVVPYPAENTVDLTRSMSILQKAYNIYHTRGSQAADAGTTQRFIKFLSTHILNDIDIHMEISDMLASSLVLGGQLELCTESFGFCNISDHNTYVSCSQDFDEENPTQPDSDCKINDRRNYASKSCHHGIYNSRIKQDSSEDVFGTTNDEDPLLYLTPVAYVVHYAFRGAELKDISRLEYTELIIVVRKTKTIKTTLPYASSPIQASDFERNPRHAGRHANKTFDFHPLHPLALSHHQQLRSKHLCMKLSGEHPKRPPFPAPLETEEEAEYNSWEVQANMYAKFYLLLLRPESTVYGGQENKNSYDWKTLVTWIASLETNKCKISTFRLKAYYRWSASFKNSKFDEAAKLYKSSNRKLWSDQEQSNYTDAMKNTNIKKTPEDNLADDENALLQESLRTPSQALRNITKWKSTISFSQDQAKTLNGIHIGGRMNDKSEVAQPTVITNNEKTQFKKMHIYIPSPGNNAPAIKDIFDHICKYKPSTETERNEINTQPSAISKILSKSTSSNDEMMPMLVKEYKRILDNFLESKKLSSDKLFIAQRIRDYMCRDTAWTTIHGRDNYNFDTTLPCPLHFISGPAGVGKSFLLEILNDMIIEIQNESKGGLKLTYTGVAASNIGGFTLFMLNISPRLRQNGTVDVLDLDQIMELQQTYQLNHDAFYMIIFDEFPMIDPTNFYATHRRISQIFGQNNNRDFTSATEQDRIIDDLETNNVFFAGMPVILAGDFHQHEPVGKKGFAEWIDLKYKLELFPCEYEDNKKFFLFNSPIGIMCDYFLTAHWIELTEQNRSNDKEHIAVIQKMYSNESLTINDLKKYKILSSADIIKNPAWEYATLLTSSNFERKTFEVIQAQRFAKKHNLPIIRWMSNNKPHTPSQLEWNKDVDENDPLQYDYFIPFAIALLLHNINVGLRAANGTDVKYHSLSFNTTDETQVAKEMIDECNESGTFITLPFVPLSINVELFFDRDDDTEEQKRANEQARFNWKSLRILDNNFPNKLIVPICHYTMNQNQGYSMYLRSKTMHLVKVKQIPYIPLYLTFAITSLKAQSRTMPRVILSLVPDGVKNQMKMTYNEFNVNISRAQGSIDNIRFLLPEGKTHNSLTSITKLKFKAPIVNLINAFQYENTQNTSMSTTDTNQNNTSDEYCIKTFNKEKYKSFIRADKNLPRRKHGKNF